MTAPTAPPPKLTRKDFVSNQEVRWCPGCGDYSILAQVQRALASLDLPREEHVFISGIGCSSRFPYYMDTYGMHSIHGRAPTIATGLKCARPDLTVWVVTGDGDSLSIGGNHLIHVLRRNVNLNILLFNNRIYGLTKGQYSPASEQGKRTKSSPAGSIDYPFQPLSLAIAAEATFVARTVDRNAKHLQETLRAAYAHQGTSFVEILQNCPIFNDGAWKDATEAATKHDRTIMLEEGKCLIFGNDQDKGVRLVGTELETVDLRGGGVDLDSLLVHDSSRPDPTPAFLLSRFAWPQQPIPMGIFRRIERPSYDSMLSERVDSAREKGADLQALLTGPETWTVE